MLCVSVARASASFSCTWSWAHGRQSVEPFSDRADDSTLNSGGRVVSEAEEVDARRRCSPGTAAGGTFSIPDTVLLPTAPPFSAAGFCLLMRQCSSSRRRASADTRGGQWRGRGEWVEVGACYSLAAATRASLLATHLQRPWCTPNTRAGIKSGSGAHCDDVASELSDTRVPTSLEPAPRPLLRLTRRRRCPLDSRPPPRRLLVSLRGPDPRHTQRKW